MLASTPVDNPGAAVLTGPVALSPFAEVQPPLATLENGQWEEWGQDCIQRHTESGAEFRECSAGSPSAPLNVVALGDSHTENWLTAFAPAIESGAIRLTSWFRGACPLSTAGSDKLGADHPDTPDCEAVNLERIALAIDMNPNVVFTTGNIADAGSPELRFTDGFIEAAEQLSRAGLPVVAMRDIPRHDERASICLEENAMDGAACSVPVDEVLASLDFNTSLPEALWENPMVTGMDLTALICFDGTCPPVIGGILTYIDDNHLTRAYIETMTPSFIDEFKNALHAVGQPIPPALTTP
ncbi:SGNH hydrolase domain-containing protein [Arenivirga flava]|nr:SGNH hydrolase domain-containing protein [Arenivirga flava]